MKSKVALLLILLLGFFFRFYDLNWDANMHLHPDERFLTMVGVAMKIPVYLFDYFDPQKSSLNPANVNYHFFVYGNLPLMINKLLAVFWGNDNYNAFTLQGRSLAAAADFLIIIFIYRLMLLLEKKYRFSKNIKLFACFFYAISVLPVQLAHFFTVDPFLNLLMFASFYFAFKNHLQGQKKDVIFSGIFFGLALACKITAIFILPLNIYFLAQGDKILFRKKINFTTIIMSLVLFCLSAYLFLRLGDPYKFSTGNWFNPTINQQYIENLKSLKGYDNKDIWYPPGVQWVNKPALTFALKNLAEYGVGLPYFFLITLGSYSLIRKKIPALWLILVWAGGFFIYQSIQFVKSMRYFLFLYPFLAVFAAFGWERVLSFLNKVRWHFLRFTLCVIGYALILLWPLMFFSIYTKDHTRVAASKWIYENIPDGSFILSEYWDDGLPLPLDQGRDKSYPSMALPVFDPDDDPKWEKMTQYLNEADYYILSSNRGWASIPSVPEKYPRMSKYYQNLLAGKTNFTKIKEFTSYPSLKYLGIPLEINTDTAEEAFTVYDHPKVIIFKNSKLSF